MNKEIAFLAGPAQWKEKLITQEDPMQLHKTLGILCLIHFAWRFSMVGADSDMGFKTYPHLTIPAICLHLLLSLSSLEFKIPEKRIKEGSRIWPEYRYCNEIEMLFYVTLLLRLLTRISQNQKNSPAFQSPQVSEISDFDWLNYLETSESSVIVYISTSHFFRMHFAA
jgi:hypothetical protein